MENGERWSAIILAVETHGFISVAKLAKQLGVSEMTIRRDLSQLEDRHQLKRVHGGAAKAASTSQEPPFTTRAAASIEEKRVVAALAADLVLDGDTIALDVGSTALELAKLLLGRLNLTIVTPNLHIAYLCMSYPNLRVIMPGGTLRTHEGSLVGALTEQSLSGLFVDKFFLGVGGVDADAGLTEYSMEDAAAKRAMAKNAKDVIALVDSSKYGKVCLNQVVPLDSIDAIVTSGKIPAQLRAAFDEADLEVIEPNNEENGGKRE